MSYKLPSLHSTGGLITAALWNEPLEPLSRKELRLVCALEEILNLGLGVGNDEDMYATLYRRLVVHGQGYGGLHARI